MSTTTPRRTSPGSSAIPPTAPQAARTRWPDPAPPGSAVRAACIHQRRAPGSPDRSRLAAKARMAAGHVPAVRPGSEQFGRAGLRRGLPCVSCNDSRANFQSGAVVRFRTPPRIRWLRELVPVNCVRASRAHKGQRHNANSAAGVGCDHPLPRCLPSGRASRTRRPESGQCWSADWRHPQSTPGPSAERGAEDRPGTG